MDSGIDDLKLKKNTVCFIDGTCGTGKSTLISFLHGYSVNKNTIYMNHNTHVSGAPGYTFSNIYRVYKRTGNYKTIFYDRRPDNNLLWRCIWQIISDYERKDEETFESYIEYNGDFVNEIIKTYTKNKMTKMINRFSNTIFLVDSNVSRVTERLIKRNNGNDRLRARDPFYIKIQNHVYTKVAESSKNINLLDVCYFKSNSYLYRIITEKTGITDHNQVMKKLKKYLGDMLSTKLETCKNKNVFTDHFKSLERYRPLYIRSFTG